MRNIFKKSLAVLLCVSTIISCVAILSACQKEEQPKKDMTVLIEGGLTSYKMIRPEKMDKSILDLVIKFRSTIVEKTETEIELATDWFKKGTELDPNAKEILIGNTNRAESQEVIESLADNSWAVVNKGNKIVICATNNSLLGIALDWFLETCLDGQAKTLMIEKDLNKIDGYGDGILISLSGVSGYSIVYPKGNKVLEYYASLVQRETSINGQKLSVVDDSSAATDCEIVIGTTSRENVPTFTKEHEYSIKTDGVKVYINASDEDTLYYAVNYYIEHGLNVNGNVIYSENGFEKTATLDGYYASGWELNLPYFEEGVIIPAYNIGPGLVNDQSADTITDSHMHVINKISYEMFTSYCNKLEQFGFRKSYSSTADGTELVGYALGAAYAYMHYSPREKLIRVIWDKSSNCEVSDIEYTEELTGTATFYQYSLDLGGSTHVYVQASGWGTIDIVKLQDNSLIIVDGGNNPSWNDGSLQGITDFLYEITGTDKKTPLNIRLWYYTHPDDDHNGLTQPWINYLKLHGYKMPEIEAVVFNYGSYRAREGYHKSGTAYQMINFMNANYPDVKYIKIHTGMTFNIGELKFETLGTIENMIGTSGVLNPSYDTNDTCTLARFTIGGKKIFLCGDTSNHYEAQFLHLNLYSSTYFKSDINQTSHHGLNLLNDLDNAIDADYALVTYSYEALHSGAHKYFIKLVSPKNLYYAANFHTAFHITSDSMTVQKVARYDHPTGDVSSIEW